MLEEVRFLSHTETDLWRWSLNTGFLEDYSI